MRKHPWILLGAGVTTAAFCLPSMSLRQDSIETLKESVRTDFRMRKGITLTDIGFVGKGENELYGFAAFEMGLRRIVKACNASRDTNNSGFVWACY